MEEIATLRRRIHELECANVRLLGLLACFDKRFLSLHQVRLDAIRKRVEETVRVNGELALELEEGFTEIRPRVQYRS